VVGLVSDQNEWIPGIIVIGQIYHPGKNHWPEAVDYNFREGKHELRLFLHSPSPDEVTAIQRLPAAFSFAVVKEAIFFAFKFGWMSWGDCGFSIHKVPENQRVLPPVSPILTENETAVLHTILVDAENGIVRAIRLCTFSRLFTLKLHQAITLQASQPFPDDWDNYAHRLAEDNPTLWLVKNKSVARCRAGDY
jgi:hypothetical protein